MLPLKLRSEPWKALSESHIVGGLPGESYAAPLSIFLACTEKHKSEVALHMQMCQKRKKLWLQECDAVSKPKGLQRQQQQSCHANEVWDWNLPAWSMTALGLNRCSAELFHTETISGPKNRPGELNTLQFLMLYHLKSRLVSLCFIVSCR